MITQLLTVATVSLVLWGYILTRRRSRPMYPPGPKPHFLWANVLDLPQERPWEVYDKWKQEYGDIIHLNLMGQHLVILNSIKSCTDLLEKRSSKYSDRPRLVMLAELMGWEWGMGFKHYSSAWRAHRKLFHQFFNEQAVGRYQETQERHIHGLLKRLLQSPAALQDHIRLLFAEIIMDVVYGIEVNGHDDIYVKTAGEAMHAISIAGNPGTFLVDIIPALRYVPSWLPGAGFQKVAAKWRASVLGARDLPFAHVKEKMAAGTARSSVVSAMLNKCEDGSLKAEGEAGLEEEPEEVAAGAAGAAYTGGADTTLSALQTFFLVMAKYPEVQKAAQAELDNAIGRGRLPTLTDIDTLPYIQAVIKELLRWHNVTPLGLPHALIVDDVYDGYFLPKGTIILPNVWSILHDPDTFPEPHIFNPSRWLITNSEGKLALNPELLDPATGGAFGFGRRVCPGRHFAMNTLHTVVPSILACYEISSASGSLEDLSTDVTTGTISYPLPYKVSLKPRSGEIVQLVNNF